MAILEQQLAPTETNDAQPLIRLTADFGPDGGFGSRDLVVTREAVQVFERGGALAFQMPIAEIQTARNEPLVGGGRLEITAKSGDILPVVTYSQTVAARFSEAARGIEQLAKSEGYRGVFLADPHVGGRYSALTAFGLVPSALAGVDVRVLLAQAKAFAQTLGSDDNAGLQLGATLGADHRDKIVLDGSSSSLVGFGDWAEQLIAESTGKLGRGLLPVVVEADAPEVSWAAADVHVVRLGTVAPVVGTAVDGSLGEQLFAWEYAVAVAGRLLGIDPFDQPDVESAKKAARGLLDAQPEPDRPLFVEGAVEVFATPGWLDGPHTLVGAVDALLATVQPRGYLAVMAYLDRLRDASLSGVRGPLARRLERPVTFGWGPRFLHSTGQFHKGGPPIGSFLQVTGLVSQDLAIPDRPFTFGTLIAAQAAGDAKVLADHGRPVLRLNLNSVDGLPQLRDVLA